MIDKFIGECRSFYTKQTYKTNLRAFVKESLGKEDVTDEETEKFYKSIMKDPIPCIMKFTAMSKKSPTSVKSIISIVFVYLDFVGVDIPEREKKKVYKRLLPAVPRTREMEVSHEIIKNLIYHMTIHAQAFTLIMITSGCRIGEVLNIRLADIDLSKDPTEIYIPETKTGIPRTVFISNEATDVLKEYLKVREAYLMHKQHMHMSRNQRMNDDRIFPFTKTTAYKFWNGVQKKSGIYQQNENGRATFVPHALRKFFVTQMSADGMPEGMVKTLVGHKDGVQSVYRRYPIQQLREAYLKHESALYINLPRGLKGNVEKAINESHEKVNEYGRTIADLVKENKEIRETNLKLLDKFENWGKEIKNLRIELNEVKKESAAT